MQKGKKYHFRIQRRGGHIDWQIDGQPFLAFDDPNPLDGPAHALLTRAAETGGLTARGWTRTLRLARTIADLEGSASVRRVHIAEALIYRRVAPGAVAPVAG